MKQIILIASAAKESHANSVTGVDTVVSSEKFGVLIQPANVEMVEARRGHLRVDKEERKVGAQCA